MEGKDIQKGPKLGMLQVEIRVDKQTKKTENKNCLPTVATVSSLPWVKTTTRCLFVLSLGRFWVFFAISAMSSVCKNTRPLGEYVKLNEWIMGNFCGVNQRSQV